MQIKHRFLTHKINSETETLIIGTFNPDANENSAEFFYGRGRNYLWKLLPTAYGDADLKGNSLEDKINFIRHRKIDFIDIISEVNVDEGEDANFYDGYLDGNVSVWRDVIEEIANLKQLKRVCITRKTFSDVPNMKAKINQIEACCHANGIQFQCLPTPARFYNADKQQLWSNFLLDGH